MHCLIAFSDLVCLLYTFIASEIYYKMSKEEAPPQREAAISKQVRIKDLPFYAEPPKVTDYRFVEDDPPLGAGLVRAARLKCTDYCNAVKARLGIVNQQLEPVKEVATATEDYIRRERDLLPKAAAITVGGMGGFVLGMRRGPVTRFVYTLGGLLTATAFCYPVETMHVLRTGVAHAQRTWEDFQKAPEPETKK